MSIKWPVNEWHQYSNLFASSGPTSFYFYLLVLFSVPQMCQGRPSRPCVQLPPTCAGAPDPCLREDPPGQIPDHHGLSCIYSVTLGPAFSRATPLCFSDATLSWHPSCLCNAVSLFPLPFASSLTTFSSGWSPGPCLRPSSPLFKMISFHFRTARLQNRVSSHHLVPNSCLGDPRPPEMQPSIGVCILPAPVRPGCQGPDVKIQRHKAKHWLKMKTDQKGQVKGKEIQSSRPK
nr:uncharacterized protein LOC123278658 [Equus asinus]